MRGIHVMTTGEALDRIAQMNEERVKQVLTLLAGQFCGNATVWPQFTAALGKPKALPTGGSGERIATA